MCKLCEIEHSDRWTCAQAKANLEDWKPKPPPPWQPPVYVPKHWEKKNAQKG